MSAASKACQQLCLLAVKRRLYQLFELCLYLLRYDQILVRDKDIVGDCDDVIDNMPIGDHLEIAATQILDGDNQ